MRIIRLVIIKRYWLSIVTSLFCLLVFTVDDQARVLAQLPTPDVNTVPNLQDLYTRTPTATAVPVVIVTATPEAQDTQPPGTQPPGTQPPGNDSLGNDSLGNDSLGNDSLGSESPGSGSTNGSTAGNEEEQTTNTNSAPAMTTDEERPTISAESGEGSAVGTTPRTAIVNTEVLNVREAPNTTGNVIDQLVRNERVTLLRQDETLIWWYICCGTTNQLQGWVSAQYLTVDATASVNRPDQGAEAETQSALQIQLLPKQHFVWQGQPLTLQVILTNPKTVPIRQVTIRADLPSEIDFVSATTSLAGSQRVENQSTEQTVVMLSWPEIAAKTQVIATLNLQIATEVANGSFIDLIAAVDATGEATTVTGISVIMPPSRLPAFP